LTGDILLSAKTYPNSIKGHKMGKRILMLKDKKKTKYIFNCPIVIL